MGRRRGYEREGGSAGDEMQEKGDELESWANDIESAADDLPDKPGGEDEDKEDEGHDFEANKEGGEPTLCAHCGKPKDDEAHRGIDDEKKADDEQLDAWRQEVKEAALEAVGNCPV